MAAMASTLNSRATGENVALSIVGFFVPPLAVSLKQGVCPTLECGIAAGLCILGWLPGYVYSLCVIWAPPAITPVSHSATGAPRDATIV